MALTRRNTGQGWLARFWQLSSHVLAYCQRPECIRDVEWMSSSKNKVVPLQPRDSGEALERLNRITGLRFARWPESLAALARQTAEENEPVKPDSVVRFGVF
jgi:hypothetical protein